LTISNQDLSVKPKNIFLTAADSLEFYLLFLRLTPGQAAYILLATQPKWQVQAGVTEPQPNFSACFGAFMPLHPTKYEMLSKKKFKTQA
jgi:phosphoenolpyruvate carboxykinase (ATP)